MYTIFTQLNIRLISTEREDSYISGTISGGKLAALKNKEKYGDDFYRVQGAKGGAVSRGGGFAAGEAGRLRAQKYGAKGGASSKRTVNPNSARQKAIAARLARKLNKV